MKVIGEEGTRDASAFVAAGDSDRTVKVGGSTAALAAADAQSQPIAVRVIDARWWLAALALAAAIWALLLSI